jgi:hypothetical protein
MKIVGVAIFFLFVTTCGIQSPIEFFWGNKTENTNKQATYHTTTINYSEKMESSDNHLTCNNFNKIAEYITSTYQDDDSGLIWEYITSYYILIDGNSVNKFIFIKPINSEEQFYRITCKSISNYECTIEKIENYNTKKESYRKIHPPKLKSPSIINKYEVLSNWFKEIITHIDKTYPIFKKGQELAKQDIEQNLMK